MVVTCLFAHTLRYVVSVAVDIAVVVVCNRVVVVCTCVVVLCGHRYLLSCELSRFAFLLWTG